MLAFDRPLDASRRAPERNVLGGVLVACSRDPLTGFFRDGCCRTGEGDVGVHTVCAVMTADFLEFTVQAGNDLVTPQPQRMRGAGQHVGPLQRLRTPPLGTGMSGAGYGLRCLFGGHRRPGNGVSDSH